MNKYMINIVECVKKHSQSDRLAVVCKGEKLSYKELDEKSDILANYMINNKIDDRPVAIYANKNIYILVCMIAALKTGNAYVPMDISFPEQRVSDVVEAVEPRVIFDFSDGEYFYEDSKQLEKYSGIKIINRQDLVGILDSDDDKLKCPVDRQRWVDGDDNSYILFTSGSTGKPKGVQISTYNLDSFVEWMSPILGIDGQEIVVMDQPAYSFDLSVSQLYPGICNGATLYSLPKDLISDFKGLLEEMKKSNMEVWVSTPSFAGMCLASDEFNEDLLPKLRKMLFIGEVLPVETARKLKERLPKAEVINGYGPTEATVGISHVVINEDHLNSGLPLPVGVPMPNCQIKIVDEEGKPLDKGQKGEIVIVGPSVSKGYFKNVEKTREAFYYDGDNSEDIDLSRRAYRTGDLGMILDDGNIKYAGRKDFQIKLNGYRIEIEDIENNLRKLSNISNAVVLPVYKNEKIAFLKGVVSLKVKNDLGNMKNSIAIKKELGQFLPEYMIPRSIVVMDQLPMNTNGKIDRKKIAEEVL